MPYTPPAQRSPAASASSSPSLSRRSSYQIPTSPRPELPRSASYLVRQHRRSTASLHTAPFGPAVSANANGHPSPTPPGTAESEKGDKNSLSGSASLRQSPPPVTDAQIPPGAIISPPDSSDEDAGLTMSSRGRSLETEKLVKLKEAIKVIEQHRASSPSKSPELAQVAQKLHLALPALSQGLRGKEQHGAATSRSLAHHRSHTESHLDVRNRRSLETPLTASDEDDLTDDDSSDGARRKPQMLRKKSGELVRPALRPSSARRRPSSMPGTPSYGKAVHFDSHLEHVRHFLQVDRPLAVSAGSSPTEQYDSDTEFPFGDDGSANDRSPPFEWDIVISNFPALTPRRLSLPVRVERVFLSPDNKTLVGSVAVANLAFNKFVTARFTLDYWKTTSEVLAEFNNDVRQPKHTDGYDRFNFNIKLADQANLEAKTMFFCVKYCVNGTEYWDNNDSTNFQIDFRKKAKLQNGKKGVQPASARPAHSLPRSHHKSPPTSAGKKLPSNFDDFAGFDPKYKFDDFHPDEYLGDERTPLRLKGVKSAVSIADNLTRRAPTANGQAFGNRYDFTASLSAAINAANSALGDRSGLVMKPSPVRKLARAQSDADDVSPKTKVSSNFSKPKAETKQAESSSSQSSGSDSPQRTGTEKPVLASQSYNELLDKYCFFGSVKSSPQIKEGTMRSGQFDGSNDDGYILNSALGSAESTAGNSPLQSLLKQGSGDASPLQKVTNQSPSPTHTQMKRSSSPAPMTGIATAIKG